MREKLEANFGSFFFFHNFRVIPNRTTKVKGLKKKNFKQRRLYETNGIT